MDKRHKQGSMSDIMAMVREAFDYLIAEWDDLERAEYISMSTERRRRRDARSPQRRERRSQRR